LNIGRLEVGGAKLILWDLGGAPSLRSIWDKYFAEAHVLVCVPKNAQKRTDACGCGLLFLA
jgi:ADP-ribosylation factor related protein 1